MLLQTEHISKEFNGVYALRDVSLDLRAGEIHGLVGENGAGKSTLIKLLTGVYALREGRILWEGRAAALPSPAAARALGICAIHQDRTLIPTFTAVENAYLGLPYPTRGGRIDWRAMTRRVRETAESLGMELDLSKTAAELSPPQRTELELVRARMTDCKLLILDEPTAALTDRESERLFALLDRLRREGAALLYVSHRLEEILRLTDRVTVLRNGAVADTRPTSALDRETLVALMSGQGASAPAEKRSAFGPPLLEAESIVTRDGAVKGAGLTVRAGEILGLFGLGGSGRTELLEGVYGARPLAGGRIRLLGEEMPRPSPASSLARGMALICEDRRGKAMIETLSVGENILLSSIDRFSRLGVCRSREGREAAQAQAEALQIKLTGLGQPMAQLSGGNQQKAVFARAFLQEPRVLLCDEPTQAVDVGTREQIHRLLRQTADGGAAVVFVSSDLSELLEVADTLQIMSRGRTGTPCPNEGLTAREVLRRCYQEEGA